MTFKAWGQSWQTIRKSLQRPILENNLLLPGVLSALLSIGLWQLGAWTTLELLGFNVLFSARNSLTHPRWDARVAVIGIDDATLREYGEFPLSRDRYAQLLETLEASPPATIGFDILFVEPSIYDSTLAEAMAINGQVVLAIAPGLQKQTLRPVPVLDHVTSKGHIVSNADLDGVTRKIFLYIDQVPSLSIKLLEGYNHNLQQTFTKDKNNSRNSLIPIPSSQLPINKQPIWINWVAPTHQIPTYSFADILQKKIDTAKLKDKILLVGMTATGANDPLRTPYEQTPPTSGIYVHAAVIDNLLNHRFLNRLPWQLDLLLLFSIGIIGSLILTPLKFSHRIVVLGILSFTWFSVSLLALTISNLWLPTAAPIGTIFLVGLSVQWQEQKEKQQLMTPGSPILN